MVFFELRWNYSPLKEKAVLLPDGLFIFVLSLRSTPLWIFYPCESTSALDASRSAVTSIAALWDKSICCY
jgi:hypothetical protein